jgi:sugar-phosphatase
MIDVAVIFDMDSLLINSEPFWHRAEVEVFNDLGVPLQENMCNQTMGLRCDEVVSYWYAKFPWTGTSQSEVAERIINRVSELVAPLGQPMPGATETIQLCQHMHLHRGLATSSPISLIDVVLNKLNLQDTFYVISSAQTEELGKPHPALYLTTANCLGVQPQKCVAVEDSIRGIISAKAASIQCITVPAPEEREDPRFTIADVKLDSLEQINELWLKEFFS